VKKSWVVATGGGNITSVGSGDGDGSHAQNGDVVFGDMQVKQLLYKHSLESRNVEDKHCVLSLVVGADGADIMKSNTTHTKKKKVNKDTQTRQYTDTFILGQIQSASCPPEVP
jgi:hypothetical protein